MMDLATVDHLLTTTRSVRKRLDLTRPVEPEIIERCIEIATQAPTGSNRQGWHFMVVTDPAKRAAVAAYYRKSFEAYISAGGPRGRGATNDPRQVRAAKVRDSAIYLSEHMHEVPVLIIPCIEGRVENPAPSAQAGFYGSILPAAWSLMLALRARGVGASWTTLHLVYEQEVADILDIPGNITQAALLPVAYFTGDDFQPAQRVPARTITYWDRWGAAR
ncbi:MAG: nitroreductase family protein [Caldilineaceae bacterium]|nr:nitroreductase family protein [Caldilineaceae bacterium]